MLKTSKSAKFLRLAMFSALFAFFMILIGAYAHISDAGLGCPDWPGCYGRLFAPTTAQEVNEARLYAPRTSDEEAKAWKDTLHRYVSGALGLLMFRLLFLGWQLKKRYRKQQVIIPAMVFLLVFAQTVLTAITVKLQFKPLILMSNLVTGFTILGLLWWVALREQRFWKPINAAPHVLDDLRPRAFIGLLLVITQIVLGGWTSANYAGLACPDFPTCRGAWWPPMDFVEGFARWRDIGLDYEGGMLSLAAATAVHMAHRLGSVITFIYITWLALHTMRLGYENNLCRFGFLVLVLGIAQVFLGATNVLFHLPIILDVMHTGLAALMLLSLITLNHVVRPRKLTTT
jgi:cytochrome c oxidase assembly protein subunit 15